MHLALYMPSLRRAREAGNSSGTRNKVLQATSRYFLLASVSQHFHCHMFHCPCHVSAACHTLHTCSIPLSLPPTFHNAYSTHTAESNKPLSYLSCHRFTARQCTTLPTSNCNSKSANLRTPHKRLHVLCADRYKPCLYRP